MRVVGVIGAGAILVVTSCLDPTEIVVDIYTNALCSDVIDTAIVVATKGAVMTSPVSATTPGCKSAGRIGRIVILPGSMPAILEVTTGFSRSAEDCRAKPGLGCVVSRREIRFVSHSALNLEIHQDVDCNGVSCDTELSTCVRGKCVDLGMDGGGMGGTCPSGRGPSMVVVAGYCIDSTEVTNAQYAAFLATNPSMTGVPVGCAFKKAFQPAQGQTWPNPNQPQTGMDWCDARAFCAWAGKRLCGLRPGAGPARIDAVDRTHDEWYLACAGPSLRAYSYGDTYDVTKCASVGQNLPAPLAVGSLKTCEGGYPGVFDLGGNAEEWVEMCEGPGPMDRCMYGPPGFLWNPADPVGSARCDGGKAPDIDPRPFTNKDTGIRCCADLL